MTLEDSAEGVGVLLLADGGRFEGKLFGANVVAEGELVFTTGMTGFQESLTDPSFAGQVLTFTYPLIGNYGVPKYENIDEYGFPKYFESNKIQVRGTIIHELCEKPSHWDSVKNLNEWLLEEDIPGICDVDTRFLTQKIRTHGVMMSILETSEKPIDISELKNNLQETLKNKFGEKVKIKMIEPKKSFHHHHHGKVHFKLKFLTLPILIDLQL